MALSRSFIKILYLHFDIYLAHAKSEESMLILVYDLFFFFFHRTHYREVTFPQPSLRGVRSWRPVNQSPVSSPSHLGLSTRQRSNTSWGKRGFDGGGDASSSPSLPFSSSHSSSSSSSYSWPDDHAVVTWWAWRQVAKNELVIRMRKERLKMDRKKNLEMEIQFYYKHGIDKLDTGVREQDRTIVEIRRSSVSGMT